MNGSKVNKQRNLKAVALPSGRRPWSHCASLARSGLAWGGWQTLAVAWQTWRWPLTLAWWLLGSARKCPSRRSPLWTARAELPVLRTSEGKSIRQFKQGRTRQLGDGDEAKPSVSFKTRPITNETFNFKLGAVNVSIYVVYCELYFLKNFSL